MRFGTAAAQHLHDQGCSYGDVSQHITHATVWWHMPLYVLRPCGKVTCGLSLCTALFTVHSVHFFFQKGRKTSKLHRKYYTTTNIKVFQLSSGACCICVDCWLHLPKFALWHWFKRFITEQSLLLCARVGGYEILLFPYLLVERSGCEMDHSERLIRKGCFSFSCIYQVWIPYM